MNRPNILIIISHDLGQHLNCYGVPSVASPNIDALAADGVLFQNAFCAAPQCSPSRSSLYTGRYPHSNGVMGLTHHLHGWDLHPAERHLAALLRDAGYDTALIGMQHETRRPKEMGYNLIDLASPCRHGPVEQKTLAYLESRRNLARPFFAQVGIWEPHRPFDVGGIPPDSQKGVVLPPFIKNEPGARHDFAAYQGAIKTIDAVVGRILRKLEDIAKEHNTLVLFTTDHGIPFPLAKSSLYDPGLRIAQIMRWPDRKWTGGRRLQPMTSNIDVLPTLLQALHLPIPSNVQGRGFCALLDRRPYNPRADIFAEMTYHDYYDPMRCIRTQQHKLIVFFSFAHFYMNISQQYRPLSEDASKRGYPNTHHPTAELYDLRAEPWEENNVLHEPAYADVARELLTRLYAWMNETRDPLLTGVPPSPFHHEALRLLAQTP